MDIKTIQNQLIENHHIFSNFVCSLPAGAFSVSHNNKWTPGQQLEHIYLSIRPLRQILALPKFMLKLLWGQANRAGRDYDSLVKKYSLKLESGGRATGRFVPKAVNMEQRDGINTALANEVQRLCVRLDHFTESELDKYVIPHPLLGKLTLREMMYFSIYHVQHHDILTRKNLE